MRLLDFIEPQSFTEWAPTAMDHTSAEKLSRILATGADPRLQAMADSLKDDHISSMQALAVLVALDLYLSDFIGREGKLLVISPQA